MSPPKEGTRPGDRVPSDQSATKTDNLQDSESDRQERPTLVGVVDRAESELASPIATASRTDLESAAHMVAPDDYQLYCSVLDGLEARQRAPQKSYRLTDPATIKPRAVEWLWDKRIATGTFSVMAGPGGVGKGALWVDLAARATRGDLHGHPLSVLILTAEERLSDVIVPRLRAADADLGRVRVLTMPEVDYDRDVTLPDDLPELREAIAETGARLVIIDPLNAHLADRIDSHKDAPLRRALGPLTRMAADTDVAVVGVAHTNKGAGDALNRVLGSVGYVNAARSVLIVGRPPDRDDGPDRIVAVPKANNTVAIPSLRFRLEGRQVQGLLPSGEEGSFEVVGVTWLGETDVSADDLLGSREDRTALADAVHFLDELLAGGPLPKVEVSRAARAEGVAEMTLRRARYSLGIVVTRDESARGRPSTWRLPDSYVSPDYVPNPLTHNQQTSDQGKRPESDDYVSDIDDDTKPPGAPSYEDRVQAVLDAFPGSVIQGELGVNELPEDPA